MSKFKKFASIEVLYEVVDILMLDMCSEPMFSSKEKQTCWRSEKPQKLLQTPKGVEMLPAQSGQSYCFAKRTGKSAVELSTQGKMKRHFSVKKGHREKRLLPYSIPFPNPQDY